MDDEALREPFMADQEGLGCPFDEALLQELAALDAAEAGGGSSGFDTTQQDGHVEDTDVYRIKELIRCAQQQVELIHCKHAVLSSTPITFTKAQSSVEPMRLSQRQRRSFAEALANLCCREKPRDVIQYLEEEGVVKLGEFLVTVSLLLLRNCCS